MSFFERFFLIVTISVIIFFAGCGENSFLPKDFLSFNKEKKEIDDTSLEVQKSQILKRLERKYQDADAHYQLGRLYQKESSWAQAEREFSIALTFDPVLRDAQTARIRALKDGGDVEKAELLAEEYIARAGGSALASLEMGLGFQEQTLDDYALECYKQALRLAPNSGKVNRQIGYYYPANGDQVRAHDYLTRSFQLNPNQPDVA
ncbi:MAG: hypothetical protein H8D47_02670, partial [Planctomycetes bacterium]|nr:hypothetical protein [Planctomycetota bacterium]